MGSRILTPQHKLKQMDIPKVLYQFKDYAGKLFQPSNGTEGMIFMEAFCEQCIHDHTPIDKFCEIIMASMAFTPKDKEYPKEWIYNEEGWPICTAWQKWDWDNDGDPDDPDNPKAPPVFDPNQLVLFSIADDVLENHKVKEKLTQQGFQA